MKKSLPSSEHHSAQYDSVLSKLIAECLLISRDENFSVSLKKHIEKLSKSNSNIQTDYYLRTMIRLFARVEELSCTELLPQEILLLGEKTKEEFINKNKLLLENSVSIAKKFNEKNYEVLFLKGISHLLTTYREREWERYLSDTDILIRRNDLEKVENILLENNYQSAYEPELIDDICEGAKRSFWEDEHFHIHFVKDKTVLELHWNCSYVTTEATTDLLFSNARTIFAQEIPIKIPTPAAQILLLTVNFFHDYLYHCLVNKYFEDREVDKLLGGFLEFVAELKEILKENTSNINWVEFQELLQTTTAKEEISYLLLIASVFGKLDIPKGSLKVSSNTGYNTLIRLATKFMRNDPLRLIYFGQKKNILVGKR